ncbi:MAG: hypothetical protein P4L92_22835 [Rudaea sp.]|nr:hypothetical protein [Rudaea sp.]
MPEWALFFEVSNGTGGNVLRYADAVAMNMFPSRGLAVHGFEIKVSRSDWLHELKQPLKSEPVQKYCDFWWVVTCKDVVKPGELPVTWGHIEYRGSKLFTVDKAPKLEAQAMNRGFAAALIRRAGELDAGQRRALVARETSRLEAEYRERIDKVRTTAGTELLALRKSVDEFEKASGIKISKYDGERIGHAVLKLFDGYDLLPSRLQSIHNLASALAKDTAAAIEELKPAGEVEGSTV